MMPIADTPSMGLLIGLPITVLLLAAYAVVFVWLRGEGDAFYRTERLVTRRAMPVLAVVTLGFAGWGFWPWQHDYHFWVPVQGEVQEVKKRIVSAGSDGGIQERFVVTINGRAYGVDDTRAALLKPGQRLSLRCKKEFEWGTPYEAHGWGCKWRGVGE